MKTVTVAQMRELDRRTMEELDIKGESLMERAGAGVALLVRRMADHNALVDPSIHIIAGRGQNGGDAFVAARILKEQGFTVDVTLAARANQISGDSLIHYSRMKSAGLDPFELPTLDDWREAIKRPFYAEIIIDGILGTGLNGPARGPAAGAIEYILANSQDSLVISIDVPSGLDADTGVAAGAAVCADVTATIGLPKKGLLAQTAIDLVGSLEVVEIGIPGEFVEELPPADPEYIHISGLKPVLRPRPRSCHKGDFGHLLVIGGSRRYGGAPLLSAHAAMRAGAGMVTLLAPASLRTVALGYLPELIMMPGEENTAGGLSAANAEWIMQHVADFDAVVIGPGLTTDEDAGVLLEAVLTHTKSPILIDADALTLFARVFPRWKKARTKMILTPHPGEMARLLGITVEEVQRDRKAAVERAVAETGKIVVLKGAGTLVAAPGCVTEINMTGNPGMATAGSGDVLAGVIGGLMLQRMILFDAARMGVFLHGRAGDYGAWRRGQASLLAGDVIDELASAMRDMSFR